MNFEGIIKSFGPHDTRKVYLVMKEFGLADEKFLEKFDAAINEGYKQLALENAKIYHEVKQNTEKMKRNEHPTNFIADGSMVFFKDKAKCPHCGGQIVSSQFCPNMKETYKDLPYGGVIMCENNILVKAQTGGTGECDYEAWMPEQRIVNTNKKPCKGCKEKK